MLFQGISAGASQADHFADGDTAMFFGELDNT